MIPVGVDVESLYRRLHKLLMAELGDLSIGYAYDEGRIREMNSLVHHIHYLSSCEVDRRIAERSMNRIKSLPLNFGVGPDSTLIVNTNEVE